MNIFPQFRSLIMLLSLFLCSQTTAVPQLPAEVTMNKAAGRGGYLIVTLRLDTGQELPFIVDTGSPMTLLDKSLEPELGKCLGKMTVTPVKDGKQKGNRYAAPKLFLGNTQLLTGSNIVTFDFNSRNFESAKGILGLDCLRHYCVQLDFVAAKVRFLNPDRAQVADFGKAFPLTFKGNYVFIQHTGLGGDSTNLMVDVGCRIDGLVNESAFRRPMTRLHQFVWDGETYTDLTVAAVDHLNSIGLAFLARHLVTLDFPGRTIYLKKTSVGPLVAKNS